MKTLTVELPWKMRAKILGRYLLALIFYYSGIFWLLMRFVNPHVAIMVYHRVTENQTATPNPYISVRKGLLRKQIKFYKKFYKIIDIDHAVELLGGDQLDRSYLVVSFDDGYLDNLEKAAEIFREQNVHPVVYLATRCIDEKLNLWPDTVRHAIYRNPSIKSTQQELIQSVLSTIAKLKQYPVEERDRLIAKIVSDASGNHSAQNVMLDWDGADALVREGWTAGAHTHNHPILSRVSDEVALSEIEISKCLIQARLDTEVRHFAYPNGRVTDFSDVHVQMLIDHGFLSAVSTNPGVNYSGADKFRLKRTGVYFTDDLPDIALRIAFQILASSDDNKHKKL